MKILIVEDEQALLQDIKNYLSSENYIIETASDFITAVNRINGFTYDCVVVDINLPKGNGFDLIRLLKEQNAESGILIISARNSIDDRLKGFDLGTDDYLVKPFHLSELNARIKAVVRRRIFNGEAKTEFNEIVLDHESMAVTVHGKPVALTAKEYNLLSYFLANRNRVLTQYAIVVHVWGNEAELFDSYEFIYTHIKNLRKKLVAAGASDYIQSVYGMGYKWK